jgi:hypothetical protein
MASSCEDRDCPSSGLQGKDRGQRDKRSHLRMASTVVARTETVPPKSYKARIKVKGKEVTTEDGQQLRGQRLTLLSPTRQG